MTKRRPKKTNPKAREPRSRYEKEECPYCGYKLAKPSLVGHLLVCDVRPEEETSYMGDNAYRFTFVFTSPVSEDLAGELGSHLAHEIRQHHLDRGEAISFIDAQDLRELDESERTHLLEQHRLAQRLKP